MGVQCPQRDRSKYFFFQKNFVKACVGARGPDWGFPRPNDVIYHMRSLFYFSTKNEDFFPLHTRYIFIFWRNENVVMGKNLHFWAKNKKGTSYDR